MDEEILKLRNEIGQLKFIPLLLAENSRFRYCAHKPKAPYAAQQLYLNLKYIKNSYELICLSTKQL